MSRLYKRRIARKMIAIAGKVVAVVVAARNLNAPKAKRKKGRCPQRKDVITMKKSTFAAILVFLSAAVGALVAAYMYIQRREKELDEYEQLLFSEEFNQTVPSAEEEESHEVPAPAVEDEDVQEIDLEQ